MKDGILWVNGHFILPQSVHEKLNKTYPFFKNEIPKMEMWVLANPKKKKKNWFRFMVNWLNKIRKEKVAVCHAKTNEEFHVKQKTYEKEVAPPPPSWQELKEKLKRKALKL